MLTMFSFYMDFNGDHKTRLFYQLPIFDSWALGAQVKSLSQKNKNRNKSKKKSTVKTIIYLLNELYQNFN